MIFLDLGLIRPVVPVKSFRIW